MIRLAGVYVAAAIGAYLLHLLSGVLSVGLEEVRRQQSVFLDRHGYRGLVVFVLTAGIAYRNESVDSSETGGETDG